MSEKLTTYEIAAILEKMATDPNGAIASSLMKTLLSKNITIDDWNTFAKILADHSINDAVLQEFSKAVIEYLESLDSKLLADEIAILKGKLEQAETDVSVLQTDVSVNAEDIALLTDSVDQNTTGIADLKESKLDKTGGTISGDLEVEGNLYVTGQSIENVLEKLNVKDAVIVTNAEGATLTVLSGFATRTGSDTTYGIMYDPATDSVKLGLVYKDGNGNYQFLAGEGYPVATRADSSAMQDGMFAVWDAANRRFVTSDVNPSVVNDLTARVGSAEGNISTLLTDVQILGGSKLDEVDAYSIIYATDAQGNQTTLTIGEGLSVENGALKATADGGTEVVANPTGSATAELSKLQVGSSVYSIPKSAPYTLPVASASSLGGIKVGDGLSIDSDGVLSADERTIATPDNMVTTDTDQEISGVKTFTGEIDATSAAVTLPGGNTWLNGELNIGTSVASQGTVLFPTPGAGNTVTLATTNDISTAIANAITTALNTSV